MRKYDLFISHSSEDNESIVQPLKKALEDKGLSVWVDHSAIKSGQTFRDQINNGIRSSRFFLSVISKASMNSRWIKEEINSAFQRFESDLDAIIPLLHQVTREELVNFDLMLTARSTLSTDIGIDAIAEKIADKCTPIPDQKRDGSQLSIVIGISGPSCAGKSWLAGKIAAKLGKATTQFDLDSYYKALDIVSMLPYRHDNPESVDLTEASVDLALLKRGAKVEIPQYDFETHQRNGVRAVDPARYIIVEGIFCFANERLRREIDIKIWVDAYSDLRYERRLNRDTKERGRKVDDVMEKYAAEVQPGYEQFIHPLKKYADICIENNTRYKAHQPLFAEMLVAYLLKIGG